MERENRIKEEEAWWIASIKAEKQAIDEKEHNKKMIIDKIIEEREEKAKLLCNSICEELYWRNV